MTRKTKRKKKTIYLASAAPRLSVRSLVRIPVAVLATLVVAALVFLVARHLSWLGSLRAPLMGLVTIGAMFVAYVQVGKLFPNRGGHHIRYRGNKVTYYPEEGEPVSFRTKDVNVESGVEEWLPVSSQEDELAGEPVLKPSVLLVGRDERRVDLSERYALVDETTFDELRAEGVAPAGTDLHWVSLFVVDERLVAYVFEVDRVRTTGSTYSADVKHERLF